MSTRNSNYGLSYVLEGTTASEEQQQRNARAKVAGQLGISLEEFEQQLRGKDINPPEAPIDSLLRVTVPAAKLYEPADAPVKDKFGNTPAQKAAMIHKQITRRPTDDEIEAKQFRAAYKDKTGKKMLSYVDDMTKKYDGVVYDENGYPDRASPSQYGRMAENMERMRQMTGTVKRDSKTDFKLNTAAFESANPKKDDDEHPAEKHYEDELNKIFTSNLIGEKIVLTTLNIETNVSLKKTLKSDYISSPPKVIIDFWIDDLINVDAKNMEYTAKYYLNYYWTDNRWFEIVKQAGLGQEGNAYRCVFKNENFLSFLHI